MPTAQRDEAAAPPPPPQQQQRPEGEGGAASALALINKSPIAASSSAAGPTHNQPPPLQEEEEAGAAPPASGAGAPDDSAAATPSGLGLGSSTSDSSTSDSIPPPPPSSSHHHQPPPPLSTHHHGGSVDSEASLPEGVTPRSLSDHAELMAAVAAVRAILRGQGMEGEGGGEGEGEELLSLLPTGFIVQCLRSRSGAVGEAALVAANFLRFRRVEARWPLRLTAKAVAGGPLESGTHWILPGRDAEGRGVFVFNLGRIDLAKGSLEAYQKMGAYLVERITREEAIQRLGIVMVANLHGVPFALYRRLFSPRDSRRAIRMWQEAFPCKLKKIYVVGASALMTHLLQLVVALLGKKLRARVRVLSHVKDLVDKEGLPPSILPREELGGALEGFDWPKWCEGVLKQEEEGGEADPVWGWV